MVLRLQSVSVDNIIVDPITSTIYHVEKRPSEEGRSVLVRTQGGVDVIGREFNSRTSVHEVRCPIFVEFNRIISLGLFIVWWSCCYRV